MTVAHIAYSAIVQHDSITPAGFFNDDLTLCDSASSSFTMHLPSLNVSLPFPFVSMSTLQRGEQLIHSHVSPSHCLGVSRHIGCFCRLGMQQLTEALFRIIRSDNTSWRTQLALPPRRFDRLLLFWQSVFQHDSATRCWRPAAQRTDSRRLKL